MRAEDLRQLLRRQPFQPFRVHVSDGTSYDVTHPEIVTVGPGAIRISIPPSRLPGYPVERLVLVSLLHIARVEIFVP